MRDLTRAIPFFSLFSALLVAPSLPAQVAGKKADPAPATQQKSAVDKGARKRRTPVVPFAVVDMEKAASHTMAYKKGMADGAKQQQVFQKEIEAQKAQINALKIDIESMVEDPARFRKKLEYENLVNGLTTAGKMFNAELDRQKVVNDGKIYAELCAAVAELASRRGILLVLRKHSQLTIQEMIDQRMVRNASAALARQTRLNLQRSVIYHAPDLDLTEDLIKYLKAK